MGRADGARRRVRDEHDRGARRADAGVRQRPADDAGACGSWPTLHGDKPYVVYEDERLHLRRDRRPGALARPPPRRRPRRRRGDRVALAMRNYPEWVDRLLGDHRPSARRSSGMNAWWTPPEMEYAPRRLPPEGADRRRRAHRAGAAGARRPARRAPLPLVAVRTDRELPADAARWADVVRRRPTRRRRCRRPTSIPTTTPRSSTRRAPPASRRVRRSPTAARSTTSSTSCSGRRPRRRPRPRRSPPATCRRRARRRAAPASIVSHGPDAAVPRHGVQLHPAPVHARRRHASCSCTSGTPGGRSS